MIEDQIVVRDLNPHRLSPSETTALNVFDNLMHQEQWPGDPPRNVAETLGPWRFVPEYLDLHQRVAWTDQYARVVGRGYIHIGRYLENPHLADFDIYVLPDMRRRGIARELLRDIAGVARREDRRLLLVSTDRAIPAGSEFVRRLGGRGGVDSHTNQLDIPDLNLSLVEEWCQGGRQKARSFQLESWDGAYPVDQLEAMSEIKHVMNSAPTDSLELEEFQWTAEHLQQEDRMLGQRGVWRGTMVVRHLASGELAGFTELYWNRLHPETAEQGHTAILPRYRRRGLAQWLKAEMLRRILVQRPEIKRIRSNVADSNESMLRINRRLGFKPCKTWTTWQIDLERVLIYLGSG